jgi:imidazolonepropionase-like amidohydrolase
MHRLLSIVLPPALLVSACAPSSPRLAPASVPRVAAAPPSREPAPDVTLRFDVVLADEVAGHDVLVQHADGSIDEDYEYNDRGRGPRTHARLEVGDDGLPDRIEITGKDYLKREVREVATCGAEGCAWSSNDEHGRGERALFSPLNASMTTDAITRRLAARPGGVKVLPGGTIEAREVADATLTNTGGSIHVRAWELAGAGFTPSIEWFDDDGAPFATVGDWGGTIREGWAGSRAKLVELERPLGQARRERIAREVAHRPARVAVLHARLFDPAKKTTLDDATIVIEGGTIKAVGTKLAAPSGAEMIDAGGKTVIPGLWDMHVHAGDDDGLLHLAEGVTTVRDMGNEMTSSLKRKARWDARAELGPRLILAGFVDGRGPFQAPTGLFVDTEEEAKAAVTTYAENHYAQLKIYSSIKPELVPVLVKEAHARGMRVSGHVPAHMSAEDAVNAGFDEIQHVNFVLLDVLATRDEDTRTPLRFTRIAEKAADLDLDSPAIQALVDLLARKKTVIDPTLVAFEPMLTVRPDHPNPSIAPMLARLPPQVRRSAVLGALPVPDGMDAKYRESFKRCEQLVKRLWDRHVPIVAGTDEFPVGIALHHELELYAEAGIPNADVLALATLGAAKVMHLDKTSGSIAPGKDADLVILDGDPLTKMSDVRNVVTVIKGGTVIDAVAAQRALSIAPR